MSPFPLWRRKGKEEGYIWSEGEGEEEKDAGKQESRFLSSSRSVSVRASRLGRPTQKAKPSSSSSSYALELKAGEAESH